MYDRLKHTIDTLRIIDGHGHPGFAMYFSGLPEERRIPFATDTFKTPEESCGGFPFLRDLHYEAYARFYGFTASEIQDPEKREQLVATLEEKRRAIADWIDELMDSAGV